MHRVQLNPHENQILEEALSQHGFRFTQQRKHVFAVLLHERDHPTVEEVFERSKEGMPSISLATVYNCLENLVGCGLVRQVNIDREPSRYCPNLKEHAHFHCKASGRVYDIPLPASIVAHLKEILPAEFSATGIEIAFHGQYIPSQS